jgi:hypothetical protein
LVPIDESTQAADAEMLTGRFRVPLLSLKTDFFKEKIGQINYNNYTTLETHFTNLQALNLCQKMTSPFTRNICRQYLKISSESTLYLYQLHYIANKALSLFGGKILSFILSLPEIDFKSHSAFEIRTYEKVIPEFPVLTFSTGIDKFKIAFFLKQRKGTKSLVPDFKVMHSRYATPIGHLDQEGYIWTKLAEFKPFLNLFYEASDKGRVKVFAGVMTGHCAICNKPLTDPISLRIGIGPTCANNIGAGRYFL